MEYIPQYSYRSVPTLLVGTLVQPVDHRKLFFQLWFSFFEISANTMPLPFHAGSLHEFEIRREQKQPNNAMVYCVWQTGFPILGAVWYWVILIRWVACVSVSLWKKKHCQKSTKNIPKLMSPVPRFSEKVPVVLPGHFVSSEIQNLERNLGYFAVNWQLGYGSRKVQSACFSKFWQ